MSTTPRTDRMIADLGPKAVKVSWKCLELCRSLETESTALRAALEDAAKALGWTMKQLDEEDSLEFQRCETSGCLHCDTSGYKEAKAALAKLSPFLPPSR